MIKKPTATRNDHFRQLQDQYSHILRRLVSRPASLGQCRVRNGRNGRTFEVSLRDKNCSGSMFWNRNASPSTPKRGRTPHTPPDWHQGNFTRRAEEISGIAGEIVVSFPRYTARPAVILTRPQATTAPHGAIQQQTRKSALSLHCIQSRLDSGIRPSPCTRKVSARMSMRPSA